MKDNQQLRIAHISPTYGGIAIAVARLHQGLLKIGVDSQVFRTHESETDNHLPQVAALPSSTRLLHYGDVLTKLINRRFGLRGMIHLSSLFYSFQDFDVIHLHGMDSNRFNLHALRRLSKSHTLVWTMHDKHLGTGTCGYPEPWGNCERWLTGCGKCPIANSNGWLVDFTNFVHKRKQNILDSVQMAIISPSRWMFDFTSLSPITRNKTLKLIPNCVSTDSFIPSPAAECRRELQLPTNSRLILAVASKLEQPRKGLQYFQSLLKNLKSHSDQEMGLVLVGSQPPESMMAELRAILPVYFLGSINDESKLAKVYSAADLFVITSTIDNFPSVVLESLACGTPVAGFRVGGIPDMVLPGQTGVLAELGDVEGLASEISDMFREPERLAQMKALCRERAVENYSLEVQANRHVELYRYLISERRKAMATHN